MHCNFVTTGDDDSNREDDSNRNDNSNRDNFVQVSQFGPLQQDQSLFNGSYSVFLSSTNCMFLLLNKSIS